MKRKQLYFIAILVIAVLISSLAFASCTFEEETPKQDNQQEQSGKKDISFDQVYAYAQEAGYTGTLEELIEAFKGESAYAIAVKNGYKGTEADWLVSLMGIAGEDGITPHIGSNDNWFIGEVDTGVCSRGDKGDSGNTPYIGGNGNWWIDDEDTGYSAQSISIEKIEKTDTQGNVDTYTIYFTNDETETFQVTNSSIIAEPTVKITFNANGGEVPSYNLANLVELSTGIYAVNAYKGSTIKALPAPARKNYTFLGWYVGSGTSEVKWTSAYVFAEDVTVVAKWSDATPYAIHYTMNNGENDALNPDVYTVESEITLEEPTRFGYSFVGWSGTDIDGMSKDVAIALGSTGERYYTANWDIKTFNITYALNEGENNAANPADYTFDVDFSLQAPTRNGYNFIGWSGTGINGTSEEVIVEVGSTGDRYYTANWELATYTITYDLKGGVNNARNRSTYTTTTISFNVNKPTKEYYSFVKWIDEDGLEVSAINKGSYGDKKLIAVWSPNTFNIFYDLNGGTEVKNPSTYNGDSADITLNEPIRIGYIFRGWSGTDIAGVSKTVTIPTGSFCDRTFEANWTECCEHNYAGCLCLDCGAYDHTPNENCICSECGEVAHTPDENGICSQCGNYDLSFVAVKLQTEPYFRNGSTVFFGEYPQSLVKSSTLKTELANLAGTLPTADNYHAWTSYGYTDCMWYIDVTFLGEKYRGMYYTTQRGYQRSNGYEASTLYWFKYEPIRWTILEEAEGNAIMLADVIIDSRPFSTYNNGNNYANSTIRAWLNGAFYSSSFTTLQKGIIQTVNVDNSARSEYEDNNGGGSNNYACENTNDKVWLLSVREVTRASYGFATSFGTNDSARVRYGSDYAKSQGLFVSNGAGWWWLRSPSYSNYYYAWLVNYNGYGNNLNYVSDTDEGVVPALKIGL